MRFLAILLVFQLLWEHGTATVHLQPTRNPFQKFKAFTRDNNPGYLTLDQINERLFFLQRQRPEQVQVIEIGRTYENRSINVFKISGYKNKENAIPIWIDAGLHGNEWISVAATMHLIDELFYGYFQNSKIRQLVDLVEFHILPVANPDGYEYTHTTRRSWSKNRKPFEGDEHQSQCVGVDLNRNFNVNFKESEDPCDQHYPGISFFSEEETVFMADYLIQLKPKATISLHGCGQMVLIQEEDMGHTAAHRLGILAGLIMEQKHGREYKVGNGKKMLNDASGVAGDWIKKFLRVPYVYTVLLPNDCYKKGYTTAADHHLREEEIPSVGEEVYAFVSTIAKGIADQ